MWDENLHGWHYRNAGSVMTQFEMLKRFTAGAEALEQIVPDLKSQIALMASQARAESTKSPEPENQLQFLGLLQSLDGRMMAFDETLTLLLQTTRVEQITEQRSGVLNAPTVRALIKRYPECKRVRENFPQHVLVGSNRSHDEEIRTNIGERILLSSLPGTSAGR